MSRQRMGVVAVLVGVVVGIAAVVFLFDDDDDDDGATDATTTTGAAETVTTTTAPLGPLVFEAEGVPFTFEYPATFAAVAPDQLPQGYITILGIDPINFIDVRLTAEEELSDDDLIEGIGGSLEQPGIEVLSQSTAQADGVTFITFSVTDTTSGAPTHSTLRFFRAGGRTWELACQNDDAGEAIIEPACNDMLDTFDLLE